MKGWCRVSTLVLLGLVSACATRPVVIGSGGDQVWTLNGRLGISAGRRHGTFTIDWQEKKDSYRIDLLGPMGIGVARVTGDGSKVMLELPNQAPLVANSPDRLLSDSLGLDIPVTPLRYWVRGGPAPGPYSKTSTGIRQMGWQIDYLEYADGLPVKIKLARPEVKLMMVVRRWTD